MKIFKKYFKWIVVGVLAFITLFQACVTPVMAAPGGSNSNDYRKTWLDIKKGQSISDIDTSTITMDDLRMLAIFISNFYVPWSTAFDGEDDYNLKEKVIKTLTKTCGFDEKVATALTEAVYEASLSTAKPLYIKSDDQTAISLLGAATGGLEMGSDITMYAPITIGDKTYTYTPDKAFELNPQNVINTTYDSGAFDSIKKTPDASTNLPEGIYRFTYGMFLSGVAYQVEGGIDAFWSDSSSPSDSDASEHVCFSTNSHVMNSYGMYNSNLNYKNGVGSGMATVDTNTLTGLSSANIPKVISPLSQLYVDWVGNVIIDDGVNRFVILPACMNPYTFKVIEGNPGSRVNLISLLGFKYMQNKWAEPTGDSGDGSKERFKFAVYNGKQSLFNLDKWRPTRGESETQILDGVFGAGKTESAKALDEALSGLYMGVSDANAVSFPEWDSRLQDPDKFLETTGDYSWTDATSMVFADYILLDDIQEYEWDESQISQYFLPKDILTDPSDTSYTVSFSSISDFGDTVSLSNSDDASLTKIYLTYLFAYSNYQKGATKFEGKENIIDMAFAGDLFPTDFNNEIDWGEIVKEAGDDQLQSEIMSMVYYILHPAEGMRYFSVWAKNKISAFLLGWHEDMVGATSSNTSTGMTRYIGFAGYTTLPALDDMSWTNWLLENYNSIIVYLIIIIAVILCCYIIVGSLTTQRALVGMFMFAILAFIPPVAINAAVGIVNQACDAIYGTKFTYWALVQHQAYLSDLYAAVNSESADEYKNNVLKIQYARQDDEGFNASAEEQTENGYAAVKLKWMSPKKDNYLASFMGELEDLTGNEDNSEDPDNPENGSEGSDDSSDTGEDEGEGTDTSEDTEETSEEPEDLGEGTSNVVTNLTRGLLSQQVSGEEFLDSPNALYLYRDYMNITAYSLKSYNLYNTYFGGSESGGNFVNFEDGEYKNQVGNQWIGNKRNKDITYDSGFPFQAMVFANYETTSSYPSDDMLDEVSSISHLRRGFQYNTLQKEEGVNLDTRTDYYSRNTMAVNYLLNFPKAYEDIYLATETLKNDIRTGSVDIGRNKLTGYGLPQSYFNFTQTDLSQSKHDKYSKDKLDYFYYSLYSESPYYFFTYNISDQMIAHTDYQYSISKNSEVGIGEDGNFKNLLLGGNLDYFFNYNKNAGDGYGELRDFMNMHDLFYYVIPLMDKGDDLVEMFDEAYGMDLYDDIKVRFTADGYVMVTKGGDSVVIEDIIAPDGTTVDVTGAKTTERMKYKDLVADWTDEEVYKFWHNYNVTTIFNAYCTWVDTMYDCDYAKPQTIHVAGKRRVVENPLDPTSYYMSPVYKENADGTIKRDANGDPEISGWNYDGRPMVFSRSEMGYYGLEWNDLTKVEQKIIEVQDSVYEKAIDLMNYYNFDDDVLVSAYAMIQLFEFNKEFSQNSFIGESFVMYPQGYELKAFTFDAYLRLIIANTTGDDLQAENGQSLYERTMENSSITFGILLIILDILCVYLIPAFKVFFLVALFFMSVMLIVASAVKIELNILQVTWKSLIFPLLSFSAVSIGLAFLVSLFMSNGAKGVTGELSPTIQLGDPTMVIAVMIVVNAIALYLYYKICKQAAKDFIKYTKAIMSNIGGTVVGAFKAVGAAAMAGGIVSALRNRGDGFGTGGGAGSHDPKQSGKDNMPRPHSTGDMQSGGSGSGGADGASDSKKDGGYSSETAHGQTPYAGKPENEKSSGDSTNKYEKRAKEGRDKREGKSGSESNGSVSVGSSSSGKGVDAKLDGNNKHTSRSNSRTYSDNYGSARGGNNTDRSEKVKEVRSKVSTRDNASKSKSRKAQTKSDSMTNSNKTGGQRKGSSNSKRTSSSRTTQSYNNVRSRNSGTNKRARSARNSSKNYSKKSKKK